MTTQQELFEHFGIKEEASIIKGTTYQKVKELLENLIDDHGWISFAGPIGSGKTVTIFNALDELKKSEKVEFVEISSLNRKGINDITLIDSIIMTLGDVFDGSTAIPRRKRAQEHKIDRILAKAKKKGYTIVLVIDEAQELKQDTFNIIKRFRDVKLLGTGNTLGVVLIGQESLPAMIDFNEEIALRCKSYDFEYTAAEKVQMAMHYGHGLLSEEQARVVAQKAINGRGKVTPLSIKRSIEDAMENAYRVGKESLDLYHFEWKNQPTKKQPKQRKKIEVKAEDAGLVETRINKQAS